jgi:hypothetical protein
LALSIWLEQARLELELVAHPLLLQAEQAGLEVLAASVVLAH